MSYKGKESKAKVACAYCYSYKASEVAKAVSEVMSLINAQSLISREGPVLIKPNLCLSETPDKAITTHPEVVKQTVLWSIPFNQDIIVGDSPVGDADRTRLNSIWNVSGLNKAMKNIPHSRTFFESELQEFTCDINGELCAYYMAKEISEMKTIINISKFKTHSLMTYTGAVKNLYGLLPGNTKKKLHSQFPDRTNFATLLFELYLHLKPAINIVDAVIGLEGDGPGSAGSPRTLNLIMASENALALDVLAAKIMNISPANIPTNDVAIRCGLLDINAIEVVGEPIERFVKYDIKIPHTARYHSALTKRLFEISQPGIDVESDKCNQCNRCVENCPSSGIKNISGNVVIDKKACISCMICHEICPNAAIKITKPSFYNQLREGRKNQFDSGKNIE